MSVSKPFRDYDELLDKLHSKNLLIKDTKQVIDLLKKCSYFSLVGGYKKPFKKADGMYKTNTTIDDIYALYTFDAELRNLFLKNILKIENHIKAIFSHVFCKKHGETQYAYLKPTNYNYIDKNKKEIDTLIIKLQNTIDFSQKYSYLSHQKKKYNNIPLWAIIKTVTFGTLSKMYAYAPHSIQIFIEKEFSGLKIDDIVRMLDILTHTRNSCAHSERLFDKRFNSNKISDTEIHAQLHICKKGILYTHGKNDLFAVVIAFKYLLDTEEFVQFCKELNSLFSALKKQTNQIQQAQLFKYMGFPHNWQDIIKL